MIRRLLCPSLTGARAVISALNQPGLKLPAVRLRRAGNLRLEGICLFYKVRSLTPQSAFGGRGMRSLVQFKGLIPTCT